MMHKQKGKKRAKNKTVFEQRQKERQKEKGKENGKEEREKEGKMRTVDLMRESVMEGKIGRVNQGNEGEGVRRGKGRRGGEGSEGRNKTVDNNTQVRPGVLCALDSHPLPYGGDGRRGRRLEVGRESSGCVEGRD